MSRSDMLRMAKPCALLGGFGGMPPRENFLKRGNLVRFRVYFSQILSIFFFKKCHFLYKKINILDTHLLWGIRGVPRIWEGGGQEFFFSDLGICMSRSDMLRMAKPCALLGGFGGMLPRENFLKRCNLVRFRVYFDQILSLFFSRKCHFLYKKQIF